MRKHLLFYILAMLFLFVGCSNSEEFSSTTFDTSSIIITTDDIVTTNDTTDTTEHPTDTTINNKLTAMIIIGNEFGNTYFIMKEELEELGFIVTTIGVGGTTLMDSCPNHENIEVEVDMTIEDIDEDNINDFSLVFIPAGKHFRTMRYSSEVGRVLELAKTNSICISSVCSGIIVLASFEGLITGYEIAASTVTKEAIIDTGAIAIYNRVVIDGIFVTGDSGYGNKDSAPIEEMSEALYSLLVVEGDQ